MGIILGVMNLKDIFDDQYYDHLDGGILEGIKMFNNDSMSTYIRIKKILIVILSTQKFKTKKVKTIYDYYISTKRIIDIEKFDSNVLNIFSHKVLHMIRNNKIGWEKWFPIMSII